MMPQLLAQFSDRMVAQMRKTENYNLTLDSNIRLMFYIRSLECLLALKAAIHCQALYFRLQIFGAW